MKYLVLFHVSGMFSFSHKSLGVSISGDMLPPTYLFSQVSYFCIYKQTRKEKTKMKQNKNEMVLQ